MLGRIIAINDNINAIVKLTIVLYKVLIEFFINSGLFIISIMEIKTSSILGRYMSLLIFMAINSQITKKTIVPRKT